MSAKEPRRAKSDRRSASKTSVVGSTVRDVSSRLSGRGLPKGGIREQERLKVAEGALPDSTVIGRSGDEGRVRQVLRVVAAVSGVLLVVLVAVAIAMVILSHTGAFEVRSIEAVDSEHITAEEIARLANVEDGSTLLSLDADAIQENVKKNPWVARVDIDRVFPDTVRLSVRERNLGAVVAMSSGGVAWLLGDDNVWIEPLKFEVTESESVNDAALAQASSLGVILISDVPTSVNPVAGCECNDGALEAVMSVANQLSDSFKSQVVCYSASSEDDISCILSNGVEVSLGSDSNIASKEAVATRILEEYGGQITYINVRIPSRPTYRRVDSEFVREGTGATGSAVDEEPVVPKIKALEEDETETDTDTESSEGSEGEESSETENTEYSDNSGYSEYDSDYYYDDSYDSSYDYNYDYNYDYGYSYGY